MTQHFAGTTTHDAGTYWKTIVYSYESPNPSDNENTKRHVAKQLQSITVGRTKGDPTSPATLVVRGIPPHYYSSGNWIIVLTKKGEFLNESINSIFELGTIVFIGQITHVSSQVVSEGSGLLSQITQVTARPWSSVLKIPILYDVFSSYQIFDKNKLTSIVGAINATVKQNDNPVYSKITNITKDLINPWRYACVVLAFVGGITSETISRVVANMRKEGYKTGSAEQTAQEYRETATRLPNVPNDMLRDLKYDISVKPDNAFFSGFMLPLLGVQTKTSANFNSKKGCYDSEDDIKDWLDPVGDRPILTGVGPEFADNIMVWDLINQKTDRDNSTEMYTDIYYYKDEKGFLRARPVFVLRDKPYLLKNIKDRIELQSQWSVYDQLPRVELPSNTITNVSISNTFESSPNYMFSKFNSPDFKANTPISHDVYRESRIVLQEEMKRFGGIAFSYTTNYTGMTADLANREFPIQWHRDLALMLWSWNALSYKTWSGSLNLLDLSIPISIGLNIEFKLGNFTIVAQTEGVTYQAHVSAEGVIRSSCSVSFSRAMVKKKDGTLEFPGNQFHSQILMQDYDTEKYEATVPKTKIATIEALRDTVKIKRELGWDDVKGLIYPK